MRLTRAAAFAAGSCAVLATYNNVLAAQPWHRRWYVPVNVCATGAALAAGAAGGLTAADIGLRHGAPASARTASARTASARTASARTASARPVPGRTVPGRTARRAVARVLAARGLAAQGLAGPGLAGPGLAAAVAAGWAVLAAVPAARPLLRDKRITTLDGRAVAYQAMVRIPLGTVLWEETAFRGVLQAALCRVLPERAAIAATSGVFGLWHIRPTLEALRVNGLATSRRRAAAGVAAGVAATSAGGLLFSWLRSRSGSLAAPMLLHLAINSGAQLAAWAAVALPGHGSRTRQDSRHGPGAGAPSAGSATGGFAG